MKPYLKLVNFELNRFAKIYSVLVGLTIVLQIVGIVVRSRAYLAMAHNQMMVEHLTQKQYLHQHAPMNFLQFYTSRWFFGPIVIGIVVMVLYVFGIWYRDWFGKSTLSYRLLMLPHPRLNVYLSKATVVFLCVLGLVALETLLIPIEYSVFKTLVPATFRLNVTNLFQMNQNISFYINLLVPTSFLQFVTSYLIGFMAICMVFTAILFERSFRWKGIGLGIVYVGVVILIFVSPLIINGRTSYFYPIELFWIEVVLGVLLTACSITIGGLLLKHKITV